MTIEYLQKLRDNPSDGTVIRGIPLTEIAHLEQIFNNGNPFPKVLKEMLFLAGNYCYVLDLGIWDSMQEMQEEERQELLEIDSVTITRPFFFVCLASTGMGVFMFLDEGDNPVLCQILNHPTQANYYRRMDGVTLKYLIDSRIQDVLNGDNPF